MPDPAPLSGNCNVVNIWNGDNSLGISENTASVVSTQPVENTTNNNVVIEIPEVPKIEEPVMMVENINKEDKFDDSFIVQDVPTNNSNQGISEIANVDINSKGMITDNKKQEPILEITEDYDDLDDNGFDE